MSERSSGAPAGTGGGDRQRIDKWLWFARITRTRSAAQALVAAGGVRINRDKIDQPSRPVRPGDVLTIALEHRVLVLKVLDAGRRRGPPAEARRLYEDLAATPATAPDGPDAADGEDFP